MARLIVKLTKQRDQLVELSEGVTVMGRGDSADLVLRNVSVSREHALLRFEAGKATLEDLGSQNGVLVNGQRLRGLRELQRRDELTVGSFTLIYLPGGNLDRFYKGRRVDDFPPYQATAVVFNQAATHMLAQGTMERMAARVHAVEHARVLDANNPKQFWYPEEKGLSFGDDQADLGVTGCCVKGVVAELRWDGRQHAVKALSMFVAVRVNGEKTKAQGLKDGDTLRIGGSGFVYKQSG